MDKQLGKDHGFITVAAETKGAGPSRVEIQNRAFGSDMAPRMRMIGEVCNSSNYILYQAILVEKTKK